MIVLRHGAIDPGRRTAIHATHLPYVCVFEHHERVLKASAAGLSYAAEHHYFGAYCISPLPKDQSSRAESTKLIQISSFRIFSFSCISSAILL